MDTTRSEDLLRELEATDPAEAPETAELLAEVLAQELDGPDAEGEES